MNSIKHMLCIVLYHLGYKYYLRSSYHQNKVEDRMRKAMHNDGKELLSIVNQVSLEQHKAMWLEFGTLLGAYREKSFILHDFDIDVGMLSHEYDLDFENALIEKGLRKKHFFYQTRADGSKFLTEITWCLNNCSIDIFLCNEIDNVRHIFTYGKKDDESLRKNEWEVREYELPLVNPLEKVIIDNAFFRAPSQTRACLMKYYGSNFMIPDKNCSAGDRNTSMIVWDIKEAYASITSL